MEDVVQYNQIGMVIPWYGSLPVYFPLFIESLRGQPFDVWFVTDQKIALDVPPNFKIYSIEFSRLKQNFETRIGFPIKIPKPYKLCDFKPAFGFLFNDILRNYTFWGTIDIDMVMGNLSSFLTSDLLDKIDFLSGLSHYVAGSFFIMRNSSFNNELFKKSRSWKEVFTRQDMVSFTECNKHWNELKAGGNLLALNTPIESFTEVLLKEQMNGMRVHFKDIVLEPKGMLPVYVAQGHIFYEGLEHLILHLLYYKTRQKFSYNLWHSKAPYYINSFGTFSSRPNAFKFLFSRNGFVAAYRKMVIQWNKLWPAKNALD